MCKCANAIIPTKVGTGRAKMQISQICFLRKVRKLSLQMIRKYPKRKCALNTQIVIRLNIDQ